MRAETPIDTLTGGVTKDGPMNNFDVYEDVNRDPRRPDQQRVILPTTCVCQEEGDNNRARRSCNDVHPRRRRTVVLQEQIERGPHQPAAESVFEGKQSKSPMFLYHDCHSYDHIILSYQCRS